MKLFKKFLNLVRNRLALTALAVVVTGCDGNSGFSKKPSPKTFGENPERVRVGMQAVQPTWFFYRSQFGAEDWKVIESGSIAKTIQRDEKGNLLWEEDYYYSGKTYTDANGGRGWEHIAVRYDYSSKQLDILYAGITPGLRDKFPLWDKKTTNERKLEKLDETLKTWGLSRNK